MNKKATMLSKVHTDQVRMVFGNAPLSLFASILNSAILVYLLWPVLDSTRLMIWAIISVLISLFRFGLAVRFHKVHPDNNSIEAWSTWSLAGAWLAGLSWGTASYFLFAINSLPHQVFLAFVIAGTTAGAVATLSASRPAILGFVLLATLPLAYRFLQAAHVFALSMSLMILLFTLLMILVSHRFYLNLTQMLIERYKRKRAQQHDRARNKVLELLSIEAPLEKILNTIILDLEREHPLILCSILLLDEEGKRLLYGAAPSLPEAFKVYIQGLQVAEGAGCCATAAFTGQRVIVEDLRTHPSWENARDMAEKARLRSCWAEPLFSSSSKVLGTFAIYHRQAYVPDKHELAAVRHTIKLASISIERKQTGEALRLAASIYQNTSEAMMITDVDNRIIAINPAFTQVTGYEENEVIGKDPGLLASGSHDDEFFNSLWDTLNTTGHWKGEIRNLRKNGEEFVEWLTINTIYDSHGKPYRRVSLFSDITERKKADALIWKQANYDSLTQLPNRRLFKDRLEQSIKTARREGHLIALLFLDLDHFKEINDTLGHHIGDDLLIETAQRLISCVRESDTVARLGGDEFTIILNELHDATHVGAISQKILDTLARPFQLHDEQVIVSGSIGITIYPEDAQTFDELLKNADQAMFSAKQNGRNRLNYFTRSMQESSQQRMRLIRDIRMALVEDQFSIYYQPIVELGSGQICKAEALLRWQHPEQGFINPADFIPLAEETGSIHEIGNLVFQTAVEQIKQWRSRYDANFQISINKSPVQFLAENNQDEWLNYLRLQEVSPQGVVIEITEGVVLKAADSVYEKLRRFREAGIKVAIDDFGTGYSSLAYLKNFEIDYLKLDKSFVKDLETDASDLALSEAIIVMAHKLGVQVIAEGVETEAQLKILKKIECDYAQGYFFNKPMPADDFELMLQTKTGKTHQHT